jgi:adenylate cyclase
MFGNTGTPRRLKFSVVGRAVNEAARITDKCRDLDEEIVVSEKFRDIAGGDWRPLGKFELRNVNQPMALFAPD